MITTFGCALAIPGAIDLTDSTWIPFDDLPCPIDCSRFASSDHWKGRRREISGTSASAAASTPARRFGNTTFEICWTWALIGQCVTFALGSPTAVATTATSGFGAALDIVRGTRTGVVDVFSSARAAFGGRNAHTGGIAAARTRTIQHGPLRKLTGMNKADAKIGCSEGDGEEMHCAAGVRSASEDCVKALERMTFAGFDSDLYIEVAQRQKTLRTVA